LVRVDLPLAKVVYECVGGIDVLKHGWRSARRIALGGATTSLIRAIVVVNPLECSLR